LVVRGCLGEPTFSDAVDGLADHTGRSVYVEAGVLEADDTYYFPIAMHATLAAPDLCESWN
jgi:hypothetical protein